MSQRRIRVRTGLATPREWWEKLDEEFGFTIDVAADDRHYMTNAYITKEENALNLDWRGVVWCSPPWGTPGSGELYPWPARGIGETLIGHAEIVVMLLPVRTTSKWWKEFIPMAAELRFIDATLDFVPFDERVMEFTAEPHCLAIWLNGKARTRTKISSYPAR